VISSELPELVGICDRVLVMREGKIAGEVGNAPGMTPLTQENIFGNISSRAWLSSEQSG
jgi:ribose transport system ATP-binding protein